MHKQTVDVEDLEGNPVTQTFYFHFNKLEIMELELQTGGIENTIKQLSETDDAVKAYDLFKGIILSAYGKKAANNIDFYKKDPDTGRKYADDLEASPALGEIIIGFLKDPNAGAKFVEECLPPKLVKEALEEQARLDAQKGPSDEEVTTLVNEAAVLQANPETAVQPGPVDPPQQLLTVDEPKTFEQYSRDELLRMSNEEFSALVPSKPQDMSREQLQIAMERKNSA